MSPTSRDARRAATGERILAAAREEFAARGYEKATIRSIATRAGVHASSVMQHFGTKKALFDIAADFDQWGGQTPSEHLSEVLRLRLERIEPEERAMVRSMLTSAHAEGYMRDFLQGRIENLSRSLSGEDAEQRATLIVTSIFGLAIGRHLLGLPSLQRLDMDELASAGAAWFELLTDRTEPGRPE